MHSGLAETTGPASHARRGDQAQEQRHCAWSVPDAKRGAAMASSHSLVPWTMAPVSRY